MERYAETLFRFKWLWLVVLVLLPATGTYYALKTTLHVYQAQATVWAEKPAYLNAIADWNQFETPAMNQAGNVNEMLQSKKFQLEVIDQTDLKSQMRSEVAARIIIANLVKNTTVVPVGTHLIAIRYVDPRPAFTVQVVNAIIASFDSELLANANAQGAAAVSFYQTQNNNATTQLTKSEVALSDYLASHPDQTKLANDINSTASLSDPSFVLQHPELAQLMQQRDTDAKNQQQLQDELQQITFEQSSASVVEEQTFRTVDSAAVPNQPLGIRRKLITPVALSLAAALAFLTVGVLILTLLDTTIRSERLAAERFQLPVMSAIPLIPVRQRQSLLGRRTSRHDARSLLAMRARTPKLKESSL
ncbi:MAG TPA: hypothetical protein VIO57_02335 [Chloroflexota bacterium]